MSVVVVVVVAVAVAVVVAAAVVVIVIVVVLVLILVVLDVLAPAVKTLMQHRPTARAGRRLVQHAPAGLTRVPRG